MLTYVIEKENDVLGYCTTLNSATRSFVQMMQSGLRPTRILKIRGQYYGEGRHELEYTPLIESTSEDTRYNLYFVKKAI
jgi:hypothetical protein